MKCVILAAGIGKRLRPLTASTPKCLLKIGGVPLLKVTVENLLSNHITDIAVVTGFRSEQVRRYLKRTFPRNRLTFIHNPRFAATNNAYSLSLAQPFVRGESLLLLDGDILFSRALLASLLKAKRKPNRIAVRVRGPHDGEEIRVRINRWDHIREIGKGIPLASTYGESIGIEIFSAPVAAELFNILLQRMKTASGRREFYEASFQRLIDDGTRVWAVDIGDEPAVEIDTADDLARAESVIMPLLRHA